MKYDVTVLTDKRYIKPEAINDYVQNVLTEDELVMDALRSRGLSITRKAWDDPNFHWGDSHYILFRTTWDYFDRYKEFSLWLERVSKQTKMINNYATIKWNLDKHYLRDLQLAGAPIPPTVFIKRSEPAKLSSIFGLTNWKKAVLKPTISGAARHTYVVDAHNIGRHDFLFSRLIDEEDYMLQEFQPTIMTEGEISIMIIGGQYTHAILKKAKHGDFRVQDDFGGTVHPYTPSPREIEMALQIVEACPFKPVYARVDLMWDDDGQPLLGELELIEPELWFREKPEAADLLADVVVDILNN